MTPAVSDPIFHIPVQNWIAACFVVLPFFAAVLFIKWYFGPPNKDIGDPAPQRRRINVVAGPREEIAELECGHSVTLVVHPSRELPCEACKAEGRK